MKIGRLNLTLRAARESKPPVPKELGASGTINLGGFLATSEYLSELRNLSGLQTYDRMLRSDGAVQEAIEHLYAPIRNASWQIDPASDDPEHLEQAALVQCAYFEHLRRPWLEVLDEQLEYLTMGFQVSEVVWQVAEAELYYEDPNGGDRVELPPRQFVSLADFAPRLQQTIWKWNVEDGQLASVVQQVFVDAEQGYQQIEIPVERLLVFTNHKRGGEFTGRSILRAARKHWLMKEVAEKVEIVALERWGVGIAVGGLPVSEVHDEGALERLEDMLANLRGGESSFMAFPGPVNLSGSDQSYTFSIETPKGGFPDFSASINRHRGDIKAAMLARFAELGHTGVGARATGDIQSIVWFSALHAIARYICDVHQQAIKRLIDANYPNVSEYPRLTAYDIESRNLAEYGQAISQLTASGALVADSSARSAVRKAIDFPDEDEPDATDPNTPRPNDANPNDPNAPNQTEPENQPGDNQPQQAMHQADVEALRLQLESLAEDVRGAYRRNEREGLSGEILELAKAVAERDVNLKVDVEPRYEAHEHSHEHRSTGASVEEIKALLDSSARPEVASRQFVRDAQGRVKSVKELDAEGQLLRTRRALYRNDKLTGFADEPADKDG